ncbi:MAG: FtsX-like permease family protein, partial [Planctomycetes bacterium]|nr:FtsX-like permease family protein [Planctomycetota bacterium]
VDSPTTSDIMVTSGSPIGSSGQSNLMEENIGDELGGIPGVELALPSRLCTDIPFRGVRVAINTLVADKYFPVAKRRLDVHRSSNPAYSAADYEKKVRELELVREMDRPTGDSEIAGNVIVSGNFAALHGVDKGGFVTLTSSKKELKFRVLGTIEDYTWNLGTIIMNRRDYVRYWQDTKVTWFEVYIQPGADPVKVKTAIATKLSKYDLQPLTHSELRTHIEQIIERLYAIAKGQQIVVMIVASLGVVTALLISVLHQRREMGLLRAIGASQAQVVYLVLAEAALMGVLGAFLGFLFAIPLQWYALRIVFLEEAGYIFPVTIPWLESAIIVLSAIVLATAAGIGPALYGVSERIPDAIAYE